MSNPTMYAGVKFQHVLHTKWAVYFDNHPLIHTWVYEPREYSHPIQDGPKYLPHFYIQLSEWEALLEITLAPPPNSSILDIMEFLPVLDHPLYLCYGRLLSGTVPGILSFSGDPTKEIEDDIRLTDFQEFPIYHFDALEVATTVDFDSGPPQRPSNKLGSKKAVSHHLRLWRDRERKRQQQKHKRDDDDESPPDMS